MSNDKEIKYFVHPKDSIFAGMKVRENPDDAFENAIRRGMKNPDDWMYMYSAKNRDYFKHIMTRRYTSYPQVGPVEMLKENLKGKGKDYEFR